MTEVSVGLIVETLFPSVSFLDGVFGIMALADEYFCAADVPGNISAERQFVLRKLIKLGAVERVDGDSHARRATYRRQSGPWWEFFETVQLALLKLSRGELLGELPILDQSINTPYWFPNSIFVQDILEAQWMFLVMKLKEIRGKERYQGQLHDRLLAAGMFEFVPTKDNTGTDAEVRPTLSPMWLAVDALWRVVCEMDPVPLPSSPAQKRRATMQNRKQELEAQLAVEAAKQAERIRLDHGVFVEAVRMVVVPPLSQLIRLGDFLPCLVPGDFRIHYARREKRLQGYSSVEQGVFRVNKRDRYNKEVTALSDRTLCGRQADWALEDLAIEATCDACRSRDVQSLTEHNAIPMSGWQLSHLYDRLEIMAEAAPFIHPLELDNLANTPRSLGFVSDGVVHCAFWERRPTRHGFVHHEAHRVSWHDYAGGYLMLIAGQDWRVHWYKDWKYLHSILSAYCDPQR